MSDPSDGPNSEYFTMTHDPADAARPIAFVLLTAALGLVLFVPAASAQGATCTEVLTNESGRYASPAEPGGRLADAIGDQKREIGSALNDRWFDARLTNATSNRSRARIVATEVERVESNVSAIERCLGLNRSGWASDRRAPELDGDEREALSNRTRSLRERLSETQAEAERLPVGGRERHGLENETLVALERRIVAIGNATAPPNARGATADAGSVLPARAASP